MFLVLKWFISLKVVSHQSLPFVILSVAKNLYRCFVSLSMTIFNHLRANKKRTYKSVLKVFYDPAIKQVNPPA